MKIDNPTNPLCQTCQRETEYDPFTRRYYCKYCMPQWHTEVKREMADRRKRIRQEFDNTMQDHME